MKIYLDYIFFENFILDLLILYQINVFAKQKSGIPRLTIASVIGAIYVVVLTVYSNELVENLFMKLLVMNIIIYIGFVPKKFNTYIKLIGYFCAITFIYVGIVVVLAVFLNFKLSNYFNRIVIYAIGYLLTYIYNTKMWKMWKSDFKTNDLIYSIELKLNLIKKIECKAFVDTGNSLKDDIERLDIFIIEETEQLKKVKIKNYAESIKTIKMHTINGECNLNGYIFKDITIKKNNVQVCFLQKAIFIFVENKLSRNDKYLALISYETYIEKLQGVSL